MTNETTLTFKIPVELKDKLKAYADKHYMSMSTVLRTFIVEGIKQNGEDPALNN